MSRRTSQADLFDNRQGDLFALLERPAPAPLPVNVSTMACHCVGCQAEGEAAEFWQHDASGGPLCPECLHDAEAACRHCGLAFEYANGCMQTRRLILPTGEAICFWCDERRRMNLPQPQLRDDEATPEARAAFAALTWQDDTHANRMLFRLREGLGKQRTDGTAPKPKKAKAIRIEADAIGAMWAITRNRPFTEIANDLWQLLDAYDHAIRAGDNNPKSTLWAQVDRLIYEANDGSSCGSAVYRGPKRLWKAIRVRARAEKRMPMWGVPSRYRIECRGMHIVVDATNGISMQLDPDHHRPGDLSFSETGYRSMSYHGISRKDGNLRTPEETAVAILESYIDAPTKDHNGRGGKLVRWIPWAAEPWARAQRERKKVDADYRLTHPAMTPEADRPAYWAEFDRKLAQEEAKALAWMQTRGVDPYELFPEFKRPAQPSLL